MGAKTDFADVEMVVHSISGGAGMVLEILHFLGS